MFKISLITSSPRQHIKSSSSIILAPQLNPLTKLPNISPKLSIIKVQTLNILTFILPPYQGSTPNQIPLFQFGSSTKSSATRLPNYSSYTIHHQDTLNSQNIISFIPTHLFSKIHNILVLLLSPQSISSLKCTEQPQILPHLRQSSQVMSSSSRLAQSRLNYISTVKHT
jgi:hypothetical protein